ncbi:hypothetical protein A2U01_0019633, partial [Trifolium medium]|nr:hypothetical protein [Trifolium medium]
FVGGGAMRLILSCHLFTPLRLFYPHFRRRPSVSSTALSPFFGMPSLLCNVACVGSSSWVFSWFFVRRRHARGLGVGG